MLDSKNKESSAKNRYFSSCNDIIFLNKNRKKIEELQKLISFFKKNNIDIGVLRNIVDHDFRSIGVPVSVFSTKLAPLEALVKFLKEKYNLSFHEIGILLKRDEKGLWHSYQNVKDERVVFSDSDVLIPIYTFANRSLSILENVVLYLIKRHRLNPYSAAKLLGKKAGSIQTVYSRLKKKIYYESYDYFDFDLIDIQNKYAELKDILAELKGDSGVSSDYILDLIDMSEIGIEKLEIPLSIFAKDISPFESLVKYLKDNLLFSFDHIAKLLKKKYSTIYTTYQNSEKKYSGKIIVKDYSSLIPVEIFTDRRFSTLESLVNYLVSFDYSISQISLMLKRDPRTVSTVLARYRNKLAENKVRDIVQKNKKDEVDDN